MTIAASGDLLSELRSILWDGGEKSTTSLLLDADYFDDEITFEKFSAVFEQSIDETSG